MNQWELILTVVSEPIGWCALRIAYFVAANGFFYISV